MYIPLVNVSDAANGANIEHSTFGRFMAKRTWFVMVKMCMPVRENWAKFARNSREFGPNLHSQGSQQTQANSTIRIGHLTATMATQCVEKGWFFLAGTCILFF